MATITGQLTLNEVSLLEISGDPSISGGTPAPLGSLALDSSGNIWLKSASSDTSWSVLALLNNVDKLPHKKNCRVRDTGANINIASAPAIMDDITLVVGDRIMLGSQAAGYENGIYVFNGAGNPLTRATDADSADELVNIVACIDEGTLNRGTCWKQWAINITVGTTSLAWFLFGSTGGGGGTTVNKASVEVDFGTGGDYITQTVNVAWILGTSCLSFAVTPNLTDHDIEDALLEKITCTYGNIVEGSRFDLHVHAPEETSGRYIIKILGI
jgi:hypothetical protein